MEENRPIMPPPPKMPPPPPRPNVPNQQSGAQGESVQPEQNVVQSQVEPANPEVSVSETSAAATIEAQEDVGSASKKKENGAKRKKSTPRSRLFYWGGFVLCLVAIGLCIFFLVK